MSFVQLLRAATAEDHQAVDVRFGGFALDDQDDYGRFLIAHARALPAVEAALRRPDADGGAAALPDWRPRTESLAADLVALNLALPAPLAFDVAGAGRWGALYVIEGSRLGGQLLARSVPTGLPVAYLSSRHRPGEWRALLAAIEARGSEGGEAWRAAAVAGAQATFALYGEAATATRAVV